MVKRCARNCAICTGANKMRVKVFWKGYDEPSEFSGVEKVETVDDVLMLDGVTHTDVEDVLVRPELDDK